MDLLTIDAMHLFGCGVIKKMLLLITNQGDHPIHDKFKLTKKQII
jgi:hypothetical protein